MSPSHTPQRALGLISLLALALRLAVVLDLASLPTAHVLMMDADRYDAMAVALADNGWLPPAAFDQAPGYPYFLAAVYAVAGHSYLAVRLLQALIDALTVLLLGWVAARLFGPTAALVTAGAAALYGPLVFHTALVLKPTLAVFLTAAFLALWVGSQTSRSRRRRHWGLALAAGLCLGATALLRENALVLIPVAMLATVVAPLRPRPSSEEPTARPWTGRPWVRRVPAAALLALGAGLALLPTAAINYQRSGDWMLTSWQGGMNFLIGNARGATGTYSPLTGNTQHPTQERADAKALAAALLTEQRAASGVPPVNPEALSAEQLSSVLWAEARRQIAEAPGEWLALLGRKLLLFWNRYEVPDAEGYDLYRQRSVALRVAFVGFGLLGPLGLAGLGLGLARRGKATAAMALLLLGTCLSVVLFFVFARYRLPVVVFLLPLAGLAAAELPRAWRERDRRALAGAAIGFVVGTVAAFVPAFSAAERSSHEAILRFNLAAAGLEHGRTLVETTVRLRTSQPPRAAAAAEDAAATLSEAIDELDAVLTAMPSLTTARISRAVAHLRLGILFSLAQSPERARIAYDETGRDLQRARTLAREQGQPDLLRQVDELAAVLRQNRGRLP